MATGKLDDEDVLSNDGSVFGELHDMMLGDGMLDQY